MITKYSLENSKVNSISDNAGVMNTSSSLIKCMKMITITVMTTL